MQPPPRKGKLTQEVKVRFLEQLSSLQNKQQREAELLEDIRSYSKQRSAIEREYGQALQRLASQFQKRDWQRGRSETNDSSVFVVWKSVIDSTICAGQARVVASENYRSASVEAAKTARVSKEQLLRKGTEQLVKVQAELLETVKEVGKTKKQYVHLQRVSEVAKDKSADVEARLRKSDHGIFHTKASLQKLSTKFSVQLAEYSQQLGAARNEYLLTLAAVNAHQGHYYHVELPTVIKTLDGDLYERLRDHLTLISRTEMDACQATRQLFRGLLEASVQVCREQNLLLFLQDNTAFNSAPEQPFQPAGSDQVREMAREELAGKAESERAFSPIQVCLLQVRESSAGESGLEKEVRRWATRAAKDYKIQTHGQQVLQRMEARRQQATEADTPDMEKRMEEVRENIRKAEVSKVKADARLALLRQAGLDIDTWLASTMSQVLEELEQERRLSEARMSERGSTPTAEEFDLAEFEDYDDNAELFEETSSSPSTARIYPSTCRVFFPYQACQSDELSIAQGEELEVIEDGDVEEWVKARNKTGLVGYVPEKYLLFLDSVGGECSTQDRTCKEGSCEMALERELSNIMSMDLVLEPGAWLVRALYDYEGQSTEELSFPEGAIIRVLPREQGVVDDGFWKGDFNGRIGVFPSLVVEEITGVQDGGGQELPSPSPPAFSPPVLTHSAVPGSMPPPELLLEGDRQDGPASGHSSPAPRIRPLRAPPPPPTKASEDEPELHLH